MVTPSLVIVGAPNRLSMTTLRPRGPRVTRTALASLLTPASRPLRASSLYISFFAISPSSSSNQRGGGAPRGRRQRSWARASVPELLLLAGGGGDFRQHVAAGEDQHVLAVDGDLGAPVLRVDDRVAHGDAERDDLARLLRTPAGADSQDGALLGLLLGGVGDDQAARGLLLRFARTDDDPGIQRLQVHATEPS